MKHKHDYQEVSKDTVYSEYYAEMRRFRDYELAASTWHIVILLAMLSGYLTILLAWKDSEIAQFITNNLFVRLIIVIFTTLIGSGGFFAVYYAAKRYQHLRNYVTEILEPKWNNYSPLPWKIMPYKVLLLIQALLVIAVDIVIVIAK